MSKTIEINGENYIRVDDLDNYMRNEAIDECARIAHFGMTANLDAEAIRVGILALKD